jgi:hypothetical protein
MPTRRKSEIKKNQIGSMGYVGQEKTLVNGAFISQRPLS